MKCARFRIFRFSKILFPHLSLNHAINHLMCDDRVFTSISCNFGVVWWCFVTYYSFVFCPPFFKSIVIENPEWKQTWRPIHRVDLAISSVCFANYSRVIYPILKFQKTGYSISNCALIRRHFFFWWLDPLLRP